MARQLAAVGWSKPRIREFLWEHSRLPLAEWKRTGIIRWLELEAHANVARALRDPMPICRSPEQVLLAVAGGGHPTHAYWMSAVAPKLIARPIELPGQWDSLLAATADDLGPPAD